jgi:hypothetical protein
MKSLTAWGIAAYLATAGLNASEHPACQNIDFPYRGSAPEVLRDIARSCTRSQMAELYHNRARQAELMEDHAVMSRIEQTRRSTDAWTPREEVLFIGLVETLSAHYALSPLQRAAVINAAFGPANEIVELRLRGYDLQAKQLRETEFTSR